MDWIPGQARNDGGGAGMTVFLIMFAFSGGIFHWIPGQARYDGGGDGMTEEEAV